jgi:hypothetical protein
MLLAAPSPDVLNGKTNKRQSTSLFSSLFLPHVFALVFRPFCVKIIVQHRLFLRGVHILREKLQSESRHAL